MNTRDITLSVNKGFMPNSPVIIGQGDKSGVTIRATIYDNGQLVSLSGMTAKFMLRSGTSYFEDDSCTVSGSTITYAMDEEHAATVVGMAQAYFAIYQGTTHVYSTSRFDVKVLRAASTGADPAQSYSDDIVAATQAARAAADAAAEAMEDIGTAVSDAQQAATSAAQAVSDAQQAVSDADTAKQTATSAANAATTAAASATAAASSANAAAAATNAAIETANDAAARAEDAIDAMGDISEIAVPLMSSDVRGGAKLGEGLALTDGALGIDPAPQQSTGEVRGSIAALTAKGHAEQDGTPTPDNPVPIQVVRGHEVTGKTGRFVDIEAQGRNLVFGMANKYLSVGSGGVWSIAGPGANMRSALARVEPNKTYTFNRVGGNRTMIAIVDSDNPTTVVRQIANDPTLTTHTFATQSGERFVMMYVTNDVNASPVTGVQLELGSVAHDYEPYYHTTTPIPLPSRGWVASLPDGTADVLTLDGAGKVSWELPTEIQVFDGSSDEGWAGYGTGTSGKYRLNSVLIQSVARKTPTGTVAPIVCDMFAAKTLSNVYSCIQGISLDGGEAVISLYADSYQDVSSWRTYLASNNMTLLYPLAAPVTEDCGYVDMPRIVGTCTVSIPELDALGVTYLIGDSVREMAEQWYARAQSEYEQRLTDLEEAVAQIIAS